MSNAQMPKVGDRAPTFRLPAFPEGLIALSQFQGDKNVVAYFYPRDDTPGCTKEACGFGDQFSRLQKLDTVVLGISTDTVASHAKFAEKFSLPFPLLSDEKHAVCEKYGVWVEKNMYGKKSMGVQRATFLIDKSGRIAAVWPKVKVDGHVEEIAQAVRDLPKKNS